MWAQELIESFFIIAIFLNAILFIPQLYSLLKTKKSVCISLSTFFGLSLLQLIAICYGLAKHDKLICIAFSLSFIFSITICALTLKYRHKNQDNILEIDKALRNFESLLRSMPGHVYWKNRNGVYLGCNDTQAKYCGFESAVEVIGKTIYDLLPKQLAAQVDEDDKQIMQSGKEATLEEKISDSKVMLSKKIPLKDDSGNVIGLLGVSLDITERKKQELENNFATKQAQLTLNSIIANLPVHLFWLNKNGVVLGCNNLQAKAVGANSPQEIIGKTMFDIFPKDEAEKLYEANLKVMDEGQSLTVIEPSAYLNGKKSIFLSKKIPMKDDKGNIVGLLGLAFDITAEKEAEQLQAEKLIIEESLKAAQLMAASIAHEMRTPLGTISAIAGSQHDFMPVLFQGYEIAKAEDKIEEPLSRRAYEYLKESPDILMQVVSGANTFINMMLMKFNPDNVKAEKLVKLSMAASVNNAVAIYPMDEGERALVKVNTEHDFDFMGDKILFDHILFNLLKNALHYLKVAQKGEIQIWLEPGQDENIVHFKDTGKGMPQDVVKNLFGSFYSKTRHGTGVGLALCKMIMQEFKGEITCASIEGEYTHFKLSFPKVS